FYQVLFLLNATEPIDLAAQELTLGFNLVPTATNFSLEITYREDLFKAQTIERIARHFEQILRSLTQNVNQGVDEVEMLLAEERTLILGLGATAEGEWFNEGEKDLGNTEPINLRFEKIATQYPDSIAIIHGDNRWTYQQLNEFSNQIAHRLIEAGFGNGDFVGVFLERSPELIAGLMGILKAGAAYVPFDTQNPTERIVKMMEGSQAKAVISTTRWITTLEDHKLQNVLLVDELTETTRKQLSNEATQLSDRKQLSTYPTHNPDNRNQLDTWAYMLYTSGSTGAPKGAITRHNGAMNHLLAEFEAMELANGFRFLQSAGIGSDISVWQMLAPILKAGAAVIVDKLDLLDYEVVIDLLQKEKVDIVEFVPSYLWGMIDYFKYLEEVPTLPALKWIMLSGEAAPVKLVNSWISYFPHMGILNGYGPCEASDDISQYAVTEKINPNLLRVPIGRSIANMNIVVLDQYGALCPIGIAGELCVTGIGVGAGYWGLPEKNAESFIKNPFPELLGETMYRSGDLAKWLPDGNLDFLGRIDRQVKIRGHRVELGEIESLIRQHDQVKNAHLLVHRGGAQQDALVAFIVVDKETETTTESAIEAALRNVCENGLPAYMQIDFYCFIEEMPVNLSDKVDEKKLIERFDLVALTQTKTSIESEDFTAARNEIETKLVTIWEELLNVQPISIHDNFFKLGGDSIVTIQMVSRAKQIGYKLSPRNIFELPTIAALSGVIKSAENVTIAEQGLLEGTAPLAAIQHFYFENEYDASSHYNQALLVDLEKQVEAGYLQEVLKAIVEHHDALRFQYQLVDGIWQQTYGSATPRLIVETISNKEKNITAAITEICNQYQQSLSIEKGELIKLVLIKTPTAATKDRLLFVIHHLAVDGISWRIILDHFSIALDALMAGRAINLGTKTTSYREWTSFMEAYVTRKPVLAQQAYWKERATKYQALPVDRIIENRVTKDRKELTINLDASLTTALLQEVNQAYHTEIDDVLLSVLTKTICNWSGNESLVVGLEGHGREDLSETIDTSSTVGWFTNLYPVTLSSDVMDHPHELIKSVKEELRAVPNKGMSYGPLRYLQTTAAQSANASQTPWNVIFNYLGQFDNLFAGNAWFDQAKEAVGAMNAPTCPMLSNLELDGMITGGQLKMTWSYSSAEYDESTIANLAENYFVNLKAFIKHCQAKATPEKTPSDYGLSAKVSYQDLDRFLATEVNGTARGTQIQSICRLSPVQEGMLFHYLFDRDSAAYTEQYVFDFPEGLDPVIFKKCWDNVLQRHSILRSGIFHEELNVPVQCIMKEVDLPFGHLDLTKLSAPAQEEKINNFLQEDLARGFEFDQAPLLRINLLKTKASAYKMVWTCHHIILDGWSMPIIVEEILEDYGKYLKGLAPVIRAEEHYEDFIQFIEAKDNYQEEQFWQKYMEGFQAPTLLPFVGNTLDRNKGTGAVKDIYLKYDEQLLTEVKTFVQAHGLTINTLLEGVWAFLLAQYAGTTDTVFGVTVSGRPAELKAADQKVGLYINTLPLRATYHEGQNFLAFLAGLQQQHVSAMDYQYTGLSNIKTWNKLEGDLFDSILVFENYPMGEVLSTDWSLKMGAVEIKDQTNYLLTINVDITQQLSINFNYNSTLLKDDFVEMMKLHFDTVLNQILALSPENTSSFNMEDLSILSQQERELILGLKPNAVGEWFNEGAKDLGNEDPINVRFEKNAAAFPDRLAVIHGEENWTYEKLNNTANQVSHSLLAMGIEPGQFVGIYLDRTPMLVSCLLGILKIGAIYIPLDTQNPAERIEKMIESSQLHAVISTTDLLAGLPAIATKKALFVNACTTDVATQFVGKGLAIIEDVATINTAATQNPKNQNEMRSWAYILYTSGSTGEPKGAITRHDGAMNHILAEYDEMQLADGFRFLQSAGIGSDISVWQILAPILKGGAVVIVDKLDLLDYEVVLDLLQKEKVSLVEFVPSYIWGMVDYFNSLENIPTLTDLKWIMMVGEAVPVKLVNIWKDYFPQMGILNGYGPCEASDDISQYAITEKVDPNSPRVPIGRPIANMNIVIVDEAQNLCPIGIPGELCVSGVGVGAGYWKLPKKTAESFIENPFPELLGDTMYRTGDLAKWLPDGNLEFLGRIDRQVKVRGHRVELGEIE
ncbi:MAG: amino acid adenylation domain-containing protein, partial [Saprospiraceae bacterium]